jgi:hypothetical protein
MVAWKAVRKAGQKVDLMADVMVEQKVGMKAV